MSDRSNWANQAPLIRSQLAMLAQVRSAHLALPVRDRERSRRFYEQFFGFEPERAREYADGVLMLRHPEGFDLALQEEPEPGALPTFLHFGFRFDTAEQVDRLHDLMSAAGVRMIERDREHDYVGFKCRDPDDYPVEAYWEPSA